MAASMGLAAAFIAAQPETEAEAHARLRKSRVPTPTPKKGKLTKAEKKAAKRARTRGVGACEFPICAVHHICERNCTRNAGVPGTLKENDRG